MGRATPWVVIVFTFLEGIVWALNGPVFLSVVPSLIPRAELDRAVALNSVQFNMARLCGLMLAVGLIGTFGVAGAFTFNACTFLPLLIALLLTNTEALGFGDEGPHWTIAGHLKDPIRRRALVLDVQLPGPSGLEPQRQLGRSEQPIPIIFITGH